MILRMNRQMKTIIMKMLPNIISVFSAEVYLVWGN